MQQAPAATAVNVGGDVQKPQQQQLGAPPPAVAAVVPPPHWVAMPFAPPGAGAMVMPHHMSPAPPQFAPHFVPFHAVAPPPPALQPRPAPVAVAMGSPAAQHGGQEENKTIWVGDLHYWMDENYLHSCFGYTGEVSTRAPPAPQILPPAALQPKLPPKKPTFPFHISIRD
jgi:hypothetical protein